jgi:hypothetical protein
VIGYHWAVYHQHSGFNSDGIVASGMTDDPDKARTLVESVMTNRDHAAWGFLARVALQVTSPTRDNHVADWPPAGQPQVCRRTATGGLMWRRLYPLPEASEPEQATDLCPDGTGPCHCEGQRHESA